MQLQKLHQSIEILRSFMPEEGSYGTNDAMDNSEWNCDTPRGKYTYFQTDDQIVKVIFSHNHTWNCTELSFKTILKSKCTSMEDAMVFSSYLPDIDMQLDCNRGTHVFRRVVYLTLLGISEYDKVGFNGATPYLDRVYSRLSKMKYFNELIKSKTYTVKKDGRDIFLEKISSVRS